MDQEFSRVARTSSRIDQPESEAVEQSILRREIGILIRRKRLIAACLAGAALVATAYNYVARPLYRADAILAFDIGGGSALELKPVVDPRSAAYSLLEQAGVLKSQDLAHLVVSQRDPQLANELRNGVIADSPTRVFQEMGLKLGVIPEARDTVGEQVKAFRSRLIVVTEPNSAWVTISFRAYDARVATLALRALVDAYMSETAKKMELAAAERKKTQQSEVEARKGAVTGTLGALKKDAKWAGLESAETRRQLLEKQQASLQDALVSARQTRQSRRVLLDDAQSRSGRGLLALPLVREDREVATLMSRISEIEGRKVRSLTTLDVRHPEVIALSQELGAAENALNERLDVLRQTVEREYRLAEQEEATLTASLHTIERTLSELRGTTAELSLERRQIEANERALGELIDRNARDTNATVFLTPRVVEAPSDFAPLASPQRQRNFLYSIGIGLGLGIALAWLLRNLDEAIRTPEQIRASLSVPFLGLVPRVNPKSALVLNPETSDPRLVEAYRVIRTVISAAHPGDRTVFLLVTSTSPGEGKTTTSLGLAIALAGSGSRVLLVDGDVRRASLSRRVGLDRHYGLLDLLAGREASSCVALSGRFANLACLPSGQRRSDSAETLGGDSLRAAVERISEGYRWIVCDAPPVLAVADASVLCRVADEVVLVIRAGQEPVASVRAALRQLAEVGATVRGAILNAADLDADSYYYKHYYSGYYTDYTAGSDKASREAAKAAGGWEAIQ